MLASSSRPSPYQLLFLAGEFFLMVLGTLLALIIRLPDPAAELFTWKYSWHRVALVPIVMQLMFYYFDLHNFRIARPFSWTITRLAQAIAVGVLALAVIYYLLPRLFLGRGVLFLVFVNIFLLSLFWRGLYSWALRHHIFATRLLFIGMGSLADSIAEELLARSDNAYQVVCIVCPAEEEPQTGSPEAQDVVLMQAWGRLLKADVRFDIGELAGLVRYYHAELIVVALDEMRGRMPLQELLRVRMLGLPVMAGEDFFEIIGGRILADRIKTSWLVFSPGFTTSILRRLTKRGFDLSLSFLGLLFSSPLALLTALAVRLDSTGPIIYRQDRVGQYDRPFTMYKFRSMKADAEALSGPVWAQEGDERVTRVGRFIRKTRLDEIPQLWNVLTGDMSFVGPRPERPHFVKELEKLLPYYSERHNVKPGVTGWAQVCYPYGSSRAAALEKLNYDLYYIKHSSLSMDLLILIQTLRLLLFGGGGR
jgi:sugar transferase (PEP-CTERM system associated)